MNKNLALLVRFAVSFAALAILCSSASAAYKPFVPGHYVYSSGDSFATARVVNYLNASSSSGGVVFQGAQRAYYWKTLEPQKDHYDFSQIDSDIAAINALGRGQKLIIQFSYKSFASGQYQFPTYIHNNGEGIYGNPANSGTGNGYYVTDTGSHYPYVWNTAVQSRFKAMYEALAAHLDANPTVQCINNSETASGQAPIADNIYGDAIRTIFIDAKNCLTQTRLIQYANGPKSQLTKWADACIANNIGWGGPDVVPADVITDPKSEGFLVGSNSSPGCYAFYWNHWNYSNVIGHVIGDTCVKGSAVQSPDYDFAAGFEQNYVNATAALHLNYMFWRYNKTHETDIIDFVKGKVNAHGIAGGLNTTVPTGEDPDDPQPTFSSVGGEDGYVIESAQGSNVGGAFEATLAGAQGMRIGDTSNKQQYKAVVSFDTSNIPDLAIISSAQLRLTRGGLSSNPSAFGNIHVDVCTGGVQRQGRIGKCGFPSGGHRRSSGHNDLPGQ